MCRKFNIMARSKAAKEREAQIEQRRPKYETMMIDDTGETAKATAQ